MVTNMLMQFIITYCTILIIKSKEDYFDRLPIKRGLEDIKAVIHTVHLFWKLTLEVTLT